MNTAPFLRFTPVDVIQHQRDIADMRQQLAQAVAQGDVVQTLDCAGTLGGMLTSARQESEAQELLTLYLPIARHHDTLEPAAWLIHALATATQYVGDRGDANAFFNEALALTRVRGWKNLEHFVLHHWGRCLVEQQQYAQAKACFTVSLAIRESLGDARVTSSRRALEALQKLMGDFE